jgi:hypothetical protein
MMIKKTTRGQWVVWQGDAGVVGVNRSQRCIDARFFTGRIGLHHERLRAPVLGVMRAEMEAAVAECIESGLTDGAVSGVLDATAAALDIIYEKGAGFAIVPIYDHHCTECTFLARGLRSGDLYLCERDVSMHVVLRHGMQIGDYESMPIAAIDPDAHNDFAHGLLVAEDAGLLIGTGIMSTPRA